MPFRVYERFDPELPVFHHPGNRFFQLAGRHSLVRQAWEKRGEPLDEGWSICADELASLYSKGAHTSETLRLIFDFAPKAKTGISLLELATLHVYTIGYGSGELQWTVLMPMMRQALWKPLESDATEKERQKLISRYRDPGVDADESVEFLYLRGNWLWGRIGAVNAAIIEEGPRNFFRCFF